MTDRAVAVFGFLLAAALLAVFLSATQIVGEHFRAEQARAAQTEEGRR